MKTKVDKTRLRNDASMMLASFDEMYEYLKGSGDKEGSRILGSLMLYTGQFVDGLFELQQKILASKEEAKTKEKADKENLKKELRDDFEELVSHFIDNEDEEGFETLVRIKKGANVLIENLVRREGDVFEHRKDN